MSTFQNLTTAVFKPVRQIGPYSSTPPAGVAELVPFTAQVTIEEIHHDEIVITDHPVEQGAAITDHAYKKPCDLILHLGWSNSGIQAAAQSLAGLVSVTTGIQTGDFDYMQTQYNQLLALQASLIPFNVYTGKRSYQNMLIRSLSVSTDPRTEHSLLVTAVLRQILLVQTQNVSTAGTSAAVQANPASNAPTISQGIIQPVVTGYTLNSNGLLGPQVSLH